MSDALINWFTTNLNWLPREAVCFIISMVPILELRGGLVAAALLKIEMWKAIPICIAGNIIPIPFILLFINKIFAWLKTTKHFGTPIRKLEEKTLAKGDTVRKYEFLGLLLFVGIPLPGTGAWTGALLACLLEVKLKKAVPAIFLGLLLATFIMCIITYFIPWVISVL